MLGARRIAYSLYTTARGMRPLEHLSELERLADREPTRVRREALARLLEHCRQHVPYYANLLGARRAIDVESAEGVLHTLPLLTKDVIRARGSSIVSADLASRRWRHNTSGGSTGEPVQHVQDQFYADRSAATALWAFRRMGYEVGGRVYKLWGDEREVLLSESLLQRRARAWLYNTHVLNAFMMGPAQMQAYIDLMNRRPAVFVQAYAQSAYELASYAERTGQQLMPQGFVTTSAGTLHDFMRERIARVFRSPLYNYYGSREVGLIATELPACDGMWVPPWGQLIEVIDEDGRACAAGVEGEIVVTCLANFAMPLLRYRIGDRGSLLRVDPSGVQRLARVSGRVVDVFHRRDGVTVDGEFFTHLLYGRAWVTKFQFVQTSFTRVELRVVSERTADVRAEELAQIQRAVRMVMGDECVLEVRFVDEIPPLASGKYRYTICALEHPA